MSDNKKIAFDIIAVVIAAGALAVAIRSCVVADDALELSQKQFLQENAPHVIFMP